MGRKKSSARRKSKKSGPRLGERLRASFESLAGAYHDGRLTTVASAIMVGLIVVLLLAGRSVLVERSGEIRSGTIGASFNWPTASGHETSWIDEPTRARFEEMVLDQVSLDPFDRESLARARAQLIQTGWFTDLSLARQGSGVVRAEGLWRVPGAVVRQDRSSELSLVSRDGVLMSGPDAWGLHTIVGVRTSPPMVSGEKHYGEQWIGGEVEAALELLSFIQSMDGFDQVAGIDVSDFVRRGSLVIITDHGTRLIWGGTPSEPNPGEAPSATKRARLAELHRNLGRIDGGRGHLDVSLRSGVDIVNIGLQG